MFKYKKAGEKYLSIWWFFVLIIISVGIVAGVAIFNLSDRSTKELESDILISKVVDCLVDYGYINEDFLSENFDIFKNCYINKEIIEDRQHYLSVEVYNFEDFSKGEYGNIINPSPRVFGVADFKNQCKIRKVIKAESYPECSEKYVYVLGKDDKKLVLHVAAGSNQKIKKEAEV